jgi:glycosyltransferase involved in cell wall biosynthesis
MRTHEEVPRTGSRQAAGKRLGEKSRVLALVPHFQCEEWLSDCLASLVEQSRPLDGIVVIDDASPEPPLSIVARYPQVTLVQAEFNVGPYRLIQTVMEKTGYDAYLFNDADDWSTPRRLERLLAEAESTGAELVGSFEVRLFLEEGDVIPVAYPVDVNAALEDDPTAFPLLHPTSLVSRDLVLRIGGFAGGMRFSGDAEFLRRAVHAARVVNVPEYLYLRRKRVGALTTSAETGLRSKARRRVQQELWDRARSNASLVAMGEPPVLEPMSVSDPVPLRHLVGPQLRAAPSGGRNRVQQA